MILNRRTVATSVLVAIALSAAGCGTSSKSAATSSPTAPSSTAAPTRSTPSSATATATSPVVVIKNFAYQVPTSVPTDSKITVRNDDATTHTIGDKGNAFDVNVPANSSTTFTAPGKPGHYTLYCKYHGNMAGTLVVS